MVIKTNLEPGDIKKWGTLCQRPKRLTEVDQEIHFYKEHARLYMLNTGELYLYFFKDKETYHMPKYLNELLREVFSAGRRARDAELKRILAIL